MNNAVVVDNRVRVAFVIELEDPAVGAVAIRVVGLYTLHEK